MAIVLGALLLGLGLPRLIASVMTLDARAVLGSVRSGEAVTPGELAAAATDIADAARWSRDGELESGRGFLLMVLADRVPPGAEQDRLYADAETAIAGALAVAPGQPTPWMHLAWLRERRGDAAGAGAALRLSMLSGAVVPELMTFRLELGLRLLPAMDTETIGLVNRQIRLTWVIAPEFVAALSSRPGLGDLVRNALDGIGEQEMAHYLRLHGSRQPQ